MPPTFSSDSLNDIAIDSHALAQSPLGWADGESTTCCRGPMHTATRRCGLGSIVGWFPGAASVGQHVGTPPNIACFGVGQTPLYIDCEQPFASPHHPSLLLRTCSFMTWHTTTALPPPAAALVCVVSPRHRVRVSARCRTRLPFVYRLYRGPTYFTHQSIFQKRQPKLFSVPTHILHLTYHRLTFPST